MIPRRPPSFLGARARHKKTFSRESYAFPNEYSIPTIPLPPQDTTQDNNNDKDVEGGIGVKGHMRMDRDIRTEDGMMKPLSPARFRRRTTSSEDTLNKNPESKLPGREISVRFEIPESPPGNESSDLFLSPEKLDIQSYPPTSTPNPPKQPPQQTSTPHPSRIQQQLDEEADAFDSTKSFLSAYQTPHSPSRVVGGGTPRFRRQESPSKLLRTLSRATATPNLPMHDESFYHDASQYAAMPTPALKGRKPVDQQESDEDVSFDEAERTLDEIISTADEAGRRIRRVLEQSRLERVDRQSLSPPDTRTLRSRENSAGSATAEVTVGDGEEDGEANKADMSVWGEKSFFRRMARKAPGGWAFTPQPKLGRTLDLVEDRPAETMGNKGNAKVLCLDDFVNRRYLPRKHIGGSFGEEDGKKCLNQRILHHQIHKNPHQSPLPPIQYVNHRPHHPPVPSNHHPQNTTSPYLPKNHLPQKLKNPSSYPPTH